MRDITLNLRNDMKVLVAIASYGKANDRYLARVVEEYNSMPFKVDVVVLSNIPKEVAPGARVVVVGCRGRDLPFAHKQILADGLNHYDLFIYSEDDILVRACSLEAFLKVSAVLPPTDIAGFLRVEVHSDGSVNYPEVHGHFHWDAGSVRSHGEYTFAFFTNEHAACYVLTREQLRRVIDSGRFLVPPHSEKYDRLCTAATDPYTQCGLRKVVCISHLNEFLVQHLSNKYRQTSYGVDGTELCRQVNALVRIGKSGNSPRSLFETETMLPNGWYSKSYYEPVQLGAIAAIPPEVRTVLSIGCGWGSTEVWLAKRGHSVTAIPLDPVIPGGAEAKGVEIVTGDLDEARRTLAGREFDCIFLSNALHLVPDPVAVLSSYGTLLSPGGVFLALVPHTARLRTAWKELVAAWRPAPWTAALEALLSPGGVFMPAASKTRGLAGVWKSVREKESTNGAGARRGAKFHIVSKRTVRNWFRDAGLQVESLTNVLRPVRENTGRLTVTLLDRWLASEFLTVAKKVSRNPSGGQSCQDAATGTSAVGPGTEKPTGIYRAVGLGDLAAHLWRRYRALCASAFLQLR